MLRLIDTNIAILLRDLDGSTTQRIALLDELPLLSVVSLVELEGGAAASGDSLRRRRQQKILSSMEVLSFGEAEATAYGQIVAALGFSRRRIVDRMIAAQALVAGAALATLNPRDFRDVPGLQIDDWTRAASG